MKSELAMLPEEFVEDIVAFNEAHDPARDAWSLRITPVLVNNPKELGALVWLGQGDFCAKSGMRSNEFVIGCADIAGLIVELKEAKRICDKHLKKKEEKNRGL